VSQHEIGFDATPGDVHEAAGTRLRLQGVNLLWWEAGPCRKQSVTEGETMSTQAAEHHEKAAEQHEHAARHHKEAAKHHKAGNHEKAAHHAHTARGHHAQATEHAVEAAKSHVEHHGKK